jgi:UDP-N-acetylglucosamine:LPS N-acetylglucosamine transferase
MMARSFAGLLDRSGWHTRHVDSMSLLGPWGGGAGAQLFNRLVAIPGLYDALHFAHLRTGSRLADRMDWASRARLVPALRAELERHPADLVVSVFATGASAAARLKADIPALRTVVLCTDVAVHRIWAAEGTDLFMVTSAAAAECVRRYLPWAPTAIVPPPVRSAFYAAPPRDSARAALGVPANDFCVLVIDSGWGFGPLVESVSALADAGVHVLAVAGRDRRIERRLRELAATSPRITPFGFTDRVPELMSAADVVMALPGANTCAEARVVGRDLLLLDVMPGHGRDNLLHELELGRAHACVPTSRGVTASVLALREHAASQPVPARPAPRWEPAYAAALLRIGLDLRAPGPDELAEPGGQAVGVAQPQWTPSGGRTCCARSSSIPLPMRVSMAGRGPATRPNGKSARTGIRPGWRSPPPWCPAASSWTPPRPA